MIEEGMGGWPDCQEGYVHGRWAACTAADSRSGPRGYALVLRYGAEWRARVYCWTHGCRPAPPPHRRIAGSSGSDSGSQGGHPHRSKQQKRVQATGSNAGYVRYEKPSRGE